MKNVNIRIVSDVVCNNLFRKIEVADDYMINFIFEPVDQIIPGILNCTEDDFLLLHLSQYAFNSYGVSEEFLGSMRQVFLHLESLLKKSKVKIILSTIYFNCTAFSQAELIQKQKLIADCNNLIFDFVSKYESDCILVDVAGLISDSGFVKNVNLRNYGVMKFPYSNSLRKAISEEYIFHLKSYFKPRKKVIFVDADNTLWSGVVGEDGVNGIKIGHEYPGSIFYYFQLNLLRLKNAGILLCLVTKNNLADVEEAFLRIDMPLSLQDFVAVKSNWARKSSNIQQLLGGLNIGASSAVFIDDNPFEIEEVSRSNSDILCLRFDKDNFNAFHNQLLRMSQLYAHYLTAEDLSKSDSYAQEAERSFFLENSNSFEDYLRDLSIKITVSLNDESLAPRISQLTRKTNQFNLTTKRYSIAEITDFIAEEKVYSFSVEDKFGSMGVVGTVIVIDSSIDTFLLSCRAFGREIEKSMLSIVIKHINKYPLYSQYRPMQKNAMTKDFFIDNGFKEESCIDGVSNYRLDAELNLPIDNGQEIVWK